ncbi:MAG: DedA family protein [Elusimicrobiaceae bacterium]|nr:DedA family protein [Elusimicrobiaceae bacterium]
MEFLTYLVDFILHIDAHLFELVEQYGMWIYAILFIIVFCETGLVVTPFLPGDSLLFASGALAAMQGSPINLWVLIPAIFAAAVLGDTVNYEIGKWLGPKVFNRKDSWLLNQDHLHKAHAFYEKYGGKTIILARFIPIIRTFAPFVAGIGKMTYLHFISYNVIGGLIWVLLFVFGGYWFADLPLVQNHFHYVIVAIIVISVLPAVYEFFSERRKLKKNK